VLNRAKQFFIFRLLSALPYIIRNEFRVVALGTVCQIRTCYGGIRGVRASEFDFDLPGDLIAQRPMEPRDCARLMVINRQTGSWEHRIFADLPDLLHHRDVLARNITQVVPARLLGHRADTGGKWEGLFLRERPDETWEILAKTRGRPAIGEHIIVGQDLHLVLEARVEAGAWIVRPQRNGIDGQSTTALLERHGHTPLPPYIRHGRETESDRFAYQTIYAQRPGSAAAPTAGLHFTHRVFDQLVQKGITWVDLTLHIGVGTFRPIEAEDLAEHTMHAEWAELSASAAAVLEMKRREGGRVVAVGTTSARTLEAASAVEKRPRAFSGETRLFIQPGHVFSGIDALITNFHLPRSSLLVLVSAFAGLELTRAAYAEAIREQYRFFSYGDAMLII
jgi:S-adenosylmethionine:tRNA ribosyltransferase-isomerase